MLVSDQESDSILVTLNYRMICEVYMAPDRPVDTGSGSGWLWLYSTIANKMLWPVLYVYDGLLSLIQEPKKTLLSKVPSHSNPKPANVSAAKIQEPAMIEEPRKRQEAPADTGSGWDDDGWGDDSWSNSEAVG